MPGTYAAYHQIGERVVAGRLQMKVICLCALWCDSCEAYKEGFLAMAKEFPEASFAWWDIEDDAELVGERDVENFPTLLIEDGGRELFYGALPPQHEHLRRLLRNLGKKS